MKFNTFWLNPGHVLVHFGPFLVQWLKKKSMWTSNEIAILNPKSFWLQIFLDPKSFWIQNFWTQNLFWPHNFSDSKTLLVKILPELNDFDLSLVKSVFGQKRFKNSHDHQGFAQFSMSIFPARFTCVISPHFPKEKKRPALSTPSKHQASQSCLKHLRITL